MIVRLAALAEAVAELRDAQQRAAQARAALTAAQQLHTVRFAPPARPPGPPRARTAADLAAHRSPARQYRRPAREPHRASTARTRCLPGPQADAAPATRPEQVTSVRVRLQVPL